MRYVLSSWFIIHLYINKKKRAEYFFFPLNFQLNHSEKALKDTQSVKDHSNLKCSCARSAGMAVFCDTAVAYGVWWFVYRENLKTHDTRTAFWN